MDCIINYSSKYHTINLLLLLLSAFPFSQGWPQRIIILQTFLSSTSVSFALTSTLSSFIRSKNLLFGLPLFLFPGNFISIVFLPTSFLLLPRAHKINQDTEIHVIILKKSLLLIMLTNT